MAWDLRRLPVNLRTAAAVREPARFLARETLMRRATHAYRLRGSGQRAVIRHPVLDAWVLYEVFGRGEYALPEPVRRRLVALDRPVRVLDLGGHVGLFGLFAREALPGARLVSFEPDPRNLESLRRCVAENRAQDTWEVVPAAAGTRDGEASFTSDFGTSRLDAVAPGHGEGSSWERWVPAGRGGEHLQSRAATVRVVDALPFLGRCDLLKVDVEGAEWAILDDPRFAQTSALALVMEVHPGSCPAGAPAQVLAERLGAAGLSILGPPPPGDAASIVWALRDG